MDVSHVISSIFLLVILNVEVLHIYFVLHVTVLFDSVELSIDLFAVLLALFESSEVVLSGLNVGVRVNPSVIHLLPLPWFVTVAL